MENELDLMLRRMQAIADDPYEGYAVAETVGKWLGLVTQMRRERDELRSALVQSDPWIQREGAWRCIHCGEVYNLVKDLADTHQSDCIWISAHAEWAKAARQGQVGEARLCEIHDVLYHGECPECVAAY
jgi:hypothetical protein